MERIKKVLEASELDIWKTRLGKQYLDLAWYSVATLPFLAGLDHFVGYDIVQQITFLLSNTLIQIAIIVILCATFPLKAIVYQAKSEIMEEIQ